ncbi:MAG TPA: hypothetical protein VKX46_10035 [Ktedonobacteraceae bacterium]|nr:hypothetical protein [Ktedonobacteraceae bacterium]
MFDLLKKSDLHVHLTGCYFPEDLFEMAKGCYREINWNRWGFLDRYEQIFGVRLNPIDLFGRAIATGDLAELRAVSTYTYTPDGNFAEFDITSYFSICIAGYYLDRHLHEPILQPIITRHKREGIAYIEYRDAFGGERGVQSMAWAVCTLPVAILHGYVQGKVYCSPLSR